MSQLVDQYHRIATNLRVSVTDVCNLRCLYCMPEEMDFAETDQIMTFEEIIRLVNIAVGLGVNKVRLTGGEPLVRRGLASLIEQLFAVPDLSDISLTTNGVSLERQAQTLYDV